NWGPGILTLGPTVTFRESLDGPITSDKISIRDKDQFSVPLQQVRFLGFKTLKNFAWTDTGDGRTWEQRGKGYSCDVLQIEANGRKWELYAPYVIVHAIADALKHLQGH